MSYMDNLSDFHTVKDLKFDVQKLQKALEQVLKIQKTVFYFPPKNSQKF